MAHSDSFRPVLISIFSIVFFACSSNGSKALKSTDSLSSDADIESDSDAEGSSDSDGETDSPTDTDVDSDSDSESGPDTELDADTDSETAEDTESDPSDDSDTDINLDTDTESVSDTNADSESDSDSQVEANTDSAPDSGQTDETDVPTDRESDVESDSAGDSDAAAARLLSGETISQIEILLSQAAIDSLAVASDAYVEADVTVVLDDMEYSFSRVGLRLKGKWGSFRTMDQKSAFLINAQKFVDGRKIFGLKKLALNNMVQDPSMIHEFLGYSLFRAMNVPAPRSGYARVFVNGTLYGLYSVVESTDNGKFLNAWFGSDEGNLYEGEYGMDLEDGYVSSFDFDHGTEVNYADIQELVDALDAMTDPDLFMTEAAAVIDLDEYLRFAATGIYLGDWDGYAWTRNNYFIYRSPGDGRWSFIPWGIDQIFGDQLDPLGGSGRIQTMCLASTPCRQALAEKYAEVSSMEESLNLTNLALDLEQVIWDDAAADPRKEVGADAIPMGLTGVMMFLENRDESIENGLVCVDPSAIDNDGDGSSGCPGFDCNDADPTVYPGALEVCNFRDDDCNGIWDDNPDCPQCADIDGPNGEHLKFCFGSKTWSDAAADCVSYGGTLVAIHGSVLNDFINSTASGIRGDSWWIGFSDIALEGSFVWSDGSIVDYTNWSDGEPNNADGVENCGQFYLGGGQWNDLSCGNLLPYVCEVP